MRPPTLAGRFAVAFGEPIQTPFDALTHLPPIPLRVASASLEDLIGLGIRATRANSILALARAVDRGALSLEPGADLEAKMAPLKMLPGIGEWTAQYVAMRALAWPDAFPHTDLGLVKALGEKNPKQILEMADRWRPWRAYAAMHLWKSLGTPSREWRETGETL